jgi:hypothetical protein
MGSNTDTLHHGDRLFRLRSVLIWPVGPLKCLPHRNTSCWIKFNFSPHDHLPWFVFFTDLFQWVVLPRMDDRIFNDAERNIMTDDQHLRSASTFMPNYFMYSSDRLITGDSNLRRRWTAQHVWAPTKLVQTAASKILVLRKIQPEVNKYIYIYT